LFEATSGLKVNFAKSDLIPVGSVDQVGSLAKILGCGVATLLVKYLGLPLRASYKSIHIVGGIVWGFCWVWGVFFFGGFFCMRGGYFVSWVLYHGGFFCILGV
jgi:hypothetical protein